MNNWPKIAPPVMLAPNPGPIDSVLGFAISLVSFVASALDHVSTDYEIRTAANGGGIAQYSALVDAGLLVKVVPAAAISTLVTGQTYYIRARFNAAGVSSAWSADLVVTT